jgi:hypothetical protein
MAFFSAPVCAEEGACAKRPVTAIANSPTKTNLMCLPPRLVVEHVSKRAYVSTESPVNMKVTGRRLDGDAPPPKSDRPNIEIAQRFRDGSDCSRLIH